MGPLLVSLSFVVEKSLIFSNCHSVFIEKSTGIRSESELCPSSVSFNDLMIIILGPEDKRPGHKNEVIRANF